MMLKNSEIYQSDKTKKRECEGMELKEFSNRVLEKLLQAKPESESKRVRAYFKSEQDWVESLYKTAKRFEDEGNPGIVEESVDDLFEAMAYDF